MPLLVEVTRRLTLPKRLLYIVVDAGAYDLFVRSTYNTQILAKALFKYTFLSDKDCF